MMDPPPVMTKTEQKQVRQVTLNEIGLALARIEAKLDTLSGQLQRVERKIDIVGCGEAEEILRRIDKLGEDLRKKRRKR